MLHYRVGRAMQDHPYTFGIEEEYFLIRRNARRLRHMPRVFFDECVQTLGERFGSEMLQTQVEVRPPSITVPPTPKPTSSECAALWAPLPDATAWPSLPPVRIHWVSGAASAAPTSRTMTR
jgi:hypothetical protein